MYFYPVEKKKELLLAVGLNDLEAEVYLTLLNENFLTGYKIGKKIGKPTANVYKAIASLARKGALVLEDNQKGLCRAVAANEFFAAAEAGLKRKTQEAQLAFAAAPPEGYDEKSYQLQSVDLTLEKCRQLLRQCTTIVVIDAFPKSLAALLPDIQEALKRGVEVYVQAYEPLDLPGANLVIPGSSPYVLQYWQSQQLNLVVDGKEYVLALFNEKLTEVYQATWSRNLYLACMYHIGFNNEFTINLIQEAMLKPNAQELIGNILARKSRLSSNYIPGMEELLKRYALK